MNKEREERRHGACVPCGGRVSTGLLPDTTFCVQSTQPFYPSLLPPPIRRLTEGSQEAAFWFICSPGMSGSLTAFRGPHVSYRQSDGGDCPSRARIGAGPWLRTAFPLLHSSAPHPAAVARGWASVSYLRNEQVEQLVPGTLSSDYAHANS